MQRQVVQPNSASTVAIVRADNARQRVYEAVGLVGGMGRAISPGDTVFVKPNIVYPAPPPATTDVGVIAAVVELLVGAGAREVIVGDSPSSGDRKAYGISSADVMSAGGFDRLRSLGVTLLNLDEDQVVEVGVPGGVICKKLRTYRRLVEADKIISVPVMKTHFLTDVSLSIKCLYGCVAYDQRKAFHRDDIHQKVVDVAKALPPALAVIDGGIAMEGFGPKAGTPVTMDIAIASLDPVAADAIAASVMGYDPMEIDHLRIAQAQQLGIADPYRIETVGLMVSDVRRHFARPDLRCTGIFDNVDVIEGGVCRECRGRTRWSLDEAQRKGLLQRFARVGVVTGVRPRIPLPGEYQCLVVIGSCAADAIALRDLNKQPAIIFDGCPPDLAPRKIAQELENVLKDLGL